MLIDTSLIYLDNKQLLNKINKQIAEIIGLY